MLKKIFIFILLIASTFFVVAQPSGYKKLTDETSFRNNLSATAKTLTSIKSDFIQEKNLSLLDEKVISYGTFKFKKENKVRMEYTKPFSYLLIINGDKVYIKDQQKSNSFSARSNKLFTIINNIIIDCVQGTVLDNKEFSAAVYTNDKNFMVKLSPVKKELKEFFDHINVFIDGKDYSVVMFDMIEPTGDNTLITFTNKINNAPVPDSDFMAK